MKLNKKGITLVEITVAIALISIVLIFLMGLFVKVRGMYDESKIQADYEVLVANIIKAVGNDIENFGLYSVEYENASKKDALIITYDKFRPTNFCERIKKVLRIYFKDNNYYLSYAYESVTSPNSTDNSRTENITSSERITSSIRVIPEEALLDDEEKIHLDKKEEMDGSTIVKIKIPLANSKGVVYDINIFGVLGNQ